MSKICEVKLYRGLRWFSSSVEFEKGAATAKCCVSEFERALGAVSVGTSVIEIFKTYHKGATRFIIERYGPYFVDLLLRGCPRFILPRKMCRFVNKIIPKTVKVIYVRYKGPDYVRANVPKIAS